MNLQRIAKFFDRHMMALIALSILAGAALGWFSPEYAQGLKIYINLTLFLYYNIVINKGGLKQQVPVPICKGRLVKRKEWAKC